MRIRVFRIIVIILIVSLTIQTQAGSVEWNHLRLDDVGTIERPGINGMETWREYVWVEPYFSFCTYLCDQTLVLQGQYGAFPEYVYGITLAEAGIVINPNSDILPGSPFYFGFPDGRSDNFSVEIPLGETAYFAYSVAYGNLMTGEPPDPSSPSRWGWLELEVSQNGDLILLRDAFTWNRDPLTVGSTPEPSGALLWLMGGALLALRRRVPHEPRKFDILCASERRRKNKR